ncbi:MAG: iron ABC transporter permease [Alistipes sp.]|nr:iron ABC transporter permease [Alistipes sp.]
MSGSRTYILFAVLIAAAALLFVGDLLIGTTAIPLGDVWAALTGGATSEEYAVIVRELRLPKVIVAAVAGVALSASGLQMQTLFRNPLAGPYVLGVSSGATLGVALFTIGAPIIGLSGNTAVMAMGTTGMAWLGSAAILLLVMMLSRRIRNINVILIIGMMLGSTISAVVGILQYVGTEESLKAFVVWTMGSLTNVTGEQLTLIIPIAAVGTLLSVAVIKPLNMLLLGEGYARTMGLDVGRTRTLIFISTTLLAATVTAFCGPIGFIGLAMPHLARMTFRTSDHRILMPASILWGVVAMLLCCVVCDLVARGGVMLPVNTVTSLLGIPIIIIVVMRNRNSAA